MDLIWHGHSFFEVETARGTNILIDPFVENGLTSVGVRDLDPDLVVVSHGHGDHFGATLELDAPVLGIHEIATYVDAHGGEDATGAGGMNVGGTFDFEGNRLTMVPAVHSSGCPGKDGPWDGTGGDAAGFILDDGETRFYHAGDTSLFGDMRSVIGDVLEPDVAAVPIGDLFTMDPHHAAIAVDWLGVGAALPMHYGTFPPIEQDPTRFASRVADAEVAIPKVDGTVQVEGPHVVNGPVH